MRIAFGLCCLAQIGLSVPLLVPTYRETIESYSLMRCRVLDHDGTKFYKLEIVETFHRQKRIDDTPLAASIPRRLAPYDERQIVLVADYRLERGNEYVIALHLEMKGKFGLSAGGRDTVLLVDADRLIPIDRAEGVFVKDIEELFGNSLARLRAAQ